MGVYKAGSFAVPGGTGNLAVTGVGFQPQAVVFFGSNQATEDAVVTNANAGAFMGMMVDTGAALLAESNSLIPSVGQRSSGTLAILMQSVFNVVEYAASPVSMDADGFTVNFTTVAASRVVQYFAWGDWTNSTGFRNNNSTQTNTVGFPVTSMFHVGTLQSGGSTGDFARGDLGGYTFAWWGGASYSFGSQYASLSLIRYPFTGQIATRMPGSGSEISTGAGFIGPFLTEPLHFGSPSSPTDFDSLFSGGYNNMGLLGVWDGDSDCGEGTPSATPGGTVTQALAMDTVDAIILFGANGWATGAGVGSSGQAVGFGVWTPTYQGCVMVNQGGNYLYQSRNKSWCSDAAAGGANAGTITSTPGSSQFEFVTGPAAVAPESLGWIGFVSAQELWLPHIYRWLKR